MGERDHFISLEMAAVGMELVAGWGSAAIVERLRHLTDALAEGLRDTGVTLPEPRVRAPHILSLGFPSGMPEGLVERLAAAKVYAAPRLGRLRISPHVYNDDADVDRFLSEFRRAIGLKYREIFRNQTRDDCRFHAPPPYLRSGFVTQRSGTP